MVKNIFVEKDQKWVRGAWDLGARQSLRSVQTVWMGDEKGPKRLSDLTSRNEKLAV